MAVASLCGGLALANAKLGAVHGFAGPLGGMFPVPHGVACARLLPVLVEANIAALRERAPASPALARYDEVARLLTGRADARADDAVAWLAELGDTLGIPPLMEFGLTADAIPQVCAQARKASSMQGNPIELTDAELCRVLAAAMGGAR